jgi:hypothetical protein
MNCTPSVFRKPYLLYTKEELGVVRVRAIHELKEHGWLPGYGYGRSLLKARYISKLFGVVKTMVILSRKREKSVTAVPSVEEWIRREGAGCIDIERFS